MEMSRDAGSIPAASTFRPWCHRVPGTDKEDENPCYRRGFFLGRWPVPWSPGCQLMTTNDRVCRLNHSQRTPRDFDLGVEAAGSGVRESLRPPWPDRPGRCGCTASSCGCRCGEPAHGFRKATLSHLPTGVPSWKNTEARKTAEWVRLLPAG